MRSPPVGSNGLIRPGRPSKDPCRFHKGATGIGLGVLLLGAALFLGPVGLVVLVAVFGTVFIREAQRSHRLRLARGREQQRRFIQQGVVPPADIDERPYYVKHGGR